MKTILVIITWMTHAPLATVELEYHSEQECLKWKAHYEQLFTQIEDLSFIVDCKK